MKMISEEEETKKHVDKVANDDNVKQNKSCENQGLM
jgi:hypothetical protein